MAKKDGISLENSDEKEGICGWKIFNGLEPKRGEVAKKRRN